MTKKIPGMLKDENGIYVKEPVSRPAPDQPDPDLSIDGLLKKGLLGIDRSLKYILEEITAGKVDRETTGVLKDCMTMLHELKKKEKEILDSLSDEELEKLISDKK